MFYKLSHSVFKTKHLIIFSIIALLGGVAIRGATQLTVSDIRAIGGKSFIVLEQTVGAAKSVGVYITSGFQRSKYVVSINVDEWSQNTWQDITGSSNVAEKNQPAPAAQTPTVQQKPSTSQTPVIQQKTNTSPGQLPQTNVVVVTTTTSSQTQQQTTYTLSVSKSGTGSGTVSSNPSGITCGTACTKSFAQGSVVTLTALPNTNVTFVGWSGACSGVGICVVTMNIAKNVTATFAQQTQIQTSYTLLISKSGSGLGTVTSAPSGVSCGTTCSSTFSSGTAITLTTSPTSGSIFSGWGGVCSGTGTCAVTMNATKSVTATFSLIPSQASSTLTVSRAGSGSGTVTSVPSGVNCGGTCNKTFMNGTAVTLTAAPTSGSTFTGWSGACFGTGICAITVNSNQTITATFSTTPTSHEDPLVAEGFGAVTQGGAGGRTIYVTTLNPTGPGSITEAIATSGPRVVKFSVAGTITIPDSFYTNKIWVGSINGTSPSPAAGSSASDNPQAYLTIDGASAPDPGITITNGGLFLAYGMHDVIIRHITIRVGGAGGDTSRGISLSNVYNILVDHVTLEGSADQDIDFWGTGTHDATLQWSIIGPGSLCCHSKGPHAAGPLVGAGASRITMHHNLIAKEIQRTPLLYGVQGQQYADGSNPIADVRNNVVYATGGTNFNTQIGLGFHANIVGNYYIAGPGGNNPYGAIFLVTSYTDTALPSVYVSDNVSEPPATPGLYQIGTIYYNESTIATSPLITSGPFSVPSVNTQSAVSAAQQVLSSAGARPWNRQSQEAGLVNEIQNASTQVFNNLQNKNVALAKIPPAGNSSQSQLLLIFLAMCVSSLLLSASAFRVRL